MNGSEGGACIEEGVLFPVCMPLAGSADVNTVWTSQQGELSAQQSTRAHLGTNARQSSLHRVDLIVQGENTSH